MQKKVDEDDTVGHRRQSFWRYKQWAEKELSRVEKRELKREQWQCYVNSITEHLNPYCKYMLIRTDGAAGGELRKAHVSGPDLCRYQAQLLTLRAYYKYLLVKTLPGDLYTHGNAALEIAAEVTGVAARTVSRLVKYFEGCGCAEADDEEVQVQCEDSKSHTHTPHTHHTTHRQSLRDKGILTK